MALTGKFDTPQELYYAVTHSTCRTQKQTAAECGCSATQVSSILIEERMRSKIWRQIKHGNDSRETY